MDDLSRLEYSALRDTIRSRGGARILAAWPRHLGRRLDDDPDLVAEPARLGDPTLGPRDDVRSRPRPASRRRTHRPLHSGLPRRDRRERAARAAGVGTRGDATRTECPWRG